MKKLFAGLFIVLSVCISASSDIIIDCTSGTGNTGTYPTLYLGQSFTTPTGAGWTDITFKFFDGNDAALAEGDLFLLTQRYSGVVNALSSSTDGFLAQSTGISDNAWIFDSAVTLQADTQYWAYSTGNLGGVHQKF